MGTTVLIVEDRQILAESLARAFEEEGMSVVLVMDADLETVRSAASTHDPDVAVVALGFGSGAMSERVIGALSEIGVPTLVMTGGSDRIRMARCIAEGAVGIIDKWASFEAVAAMVGDRTGVTAIPPTELYALQDELRRHRARMSELRRPFERLTPREREVLRSLTEGMRAEEIAEDSFVAVSTVRTQIRSILSKLGVSSQIAAVAMAHRANWFDTTLSAV
jgi:two-component system nitrate/nitrite response regulator NarL